MTPPEAWNQALVEMARASRAYSQFLLLRNFVDGIDDEKTKSSHLGGGDDDDEEVPPVPVL